MYFIDKSMCFFVKNLDFDSYPLLYDDHIDLYRWIGVLICSVFGRFWQGEHVSGEVVALKALQLAPPPPTEYRRRLLVIPGFWWRQYHPPPTPPRHATATLFIDNVLMHCVLRHGRQSAPHSTSVTASKKPIAGSIQGLTVSQLD